MSGFFDVLRGLPTPFNMVVIIVLIVSVSSILSSVAKQIRKYACHRQELDFKRELLDRGMQGDEIEQVVRARSDDPSR